jgi:hypothetical protein
VRQDALDRDAAVEPFEPPLLREEHLRHAATGDAPEQNVLAKANTALGGHQGIIVSSPSVKRLVVTCALAGCNDAVTLAITTDKPIPEGLDGMCVGVADSSTGGGHFGRHYALSERPLPQTLRVDPGGASSALAWVRGDRGGVPVQLASAHLSFSDDVSLALDACAHGPAALPAKRGDAAGPASALLAASEGQGGVVVVAAGASAQVVDAHGGALVARDAPALPAGTVKAIASADLDGDCDDDIIVATDAAPPEIWLRDGDHFTDHLAIGSSAASAIAVGDVDGDGDLDVIVGGGASLVLYLNDGGGNLTAEPSMLSAGGHATAISALALGDIDGDGVPDLVVGQSNAALAAWHGSTGGQLTYSTAIVPAVTLDVERLVLVDADGDFDPDLAIAVRGAPMHLLIARGGRLEEQSFPLLPAPIPTVHAIAIADWDDGCYPDAVLATDAGNPTWKGDPGGMFAPEASVAPAASDAIMTDIDDDGHLDAILSTPNGAIWLAR